MAWWDADARARDLCWHPSTDDERLALWWRLREYPSERWDLRGRMNAGQRTAIWLSFLHPDDRRQVKDETSDQVLAVRDWLLMDLLDYFSIDWAMQIPLLPHRLAYLYDKSGLLPERDAVQVIARTKTFVFSLLLECDEASWQASSFVH